MDPSHRHTASMAAFRLVLFVTGAAVIANIDRPSDEKAVFLFPDARRQLGLVDPVGAALVIYETAWPEFGDRDKPGSLQICGLWPAAADRWHIGIKRETREIVPRKESLGCKIAIGIKVRSAARISALKQRQLLVRLSLLASCFLPLRCGDAVGLRLSIGFDELGSCPTIELPPTIESAGKALHRIARSRGRKCCPINCPGCRLGCHPPAVVLPLDRLFDIRVAAALRLWRSLAGRNPGPDPATLSRARRDRLILALRALDGRLAKASYREIADALFGVGEISGRAWKGHDLRDRTIRLVHYGLKMMEGGYRLLLLHPYREWS